MNGAKTFQGWDVALNHSAVVEIDEAGELVWFSYTTDKVTIAKENPEAHLFQVSKLRKQMSKKELQAKRLEFFSDWAYDALVRFPTSVCIEDYAYGKKNNAYHIGEFGGILRDYLKRCNIPYFTTSPRSLKNYAMISAQEKPIVFCWEEYGVDWEYHNAGCASESAGDLADAHVLSHMARDVYLSEQGLI